MRLQTALQLKSREALCQCNCCCCIRHPSIIFPSPYKKVSYLNRRWLTCEIVRSISQRPPCPQKQICLLVISMDVEHFWPMMQLVMREHEASCAQTLRMDFTVARKHWKRWIFIISFTHSNLNLHVIWLLQEKKKSSRHSISRHWFNHGIKTNPLHIVDYETRSVYSQSRFHVNKHVSGD